MARPKGSPNRLTKAIRTVFEETFAELQVGRSKAKLSTWARENPGDFYKLCARLLPQKVESDVRFINADVSNFTDKELEDIAAGRATAELIGRLQATARAQSSSTA